MPGPARGGCPPSFPKFPLALLVGAAARGTLQGSGAAAPEGSRVCPVHEVRSRRQLTRASVPRPSDTRMRGRSQNRIPRPQAALLTPRLPRDHGPCPPADSNSAQSGPPSGRPAGASWQLGPQEPLPRAHLSAPRRRPGLLWPSRLHIGRRCRPSQDRPPGAGGCRAAWVEPGRWVQPDPLAISSSPWVLNQSSSFSRPVLSTYWVPGLPLTAAQGKGGTVTGQSRGHTECRRADGQSLGRGRGRRLQQCRP